MAYPKHTDRDSGVSFGDSRREAIDYAYTQKVEAAERANQTWLDAHTYKPADTSSGVGYTPSGRGDPTLGIIIFGGIGAIWGFFELQNRFGQEAAIAISVAAVAAFFALRSFLRTTLGGLVGSILGYSVLLGFAAMIGYGAFLGTTGMRFEDHAMAALPKVALAGIGASVLLHRIFHWPIGTREQIERAERRADQTKRAFKIMFLACLGVAALAIVIHLSR